MAESTIPEDLDTGKVERQCRYFMAKVLGDHKAMAQIKHLRVPLPKNRPLSLQTRAHQMTTLPITWNCTSARNRSRKQQKNLEMGKHSNQQYQAQFCGQLSQDKEEVFTVISEQICLQTQSQIFWRENIR